MVTTIQIKTETLQSLKLEKAVRQCKSYDDLINTLIDTK